MSKRNSSRDSDPEDPIAFRTKRPRQDGKGDPAKDLVSILTDFMLRDLALVIRTYMGISGQVLDTWIASYPLDDTCINPQTWCNRIFITTKSPVRSIDGPIRIMDVLESGRFMKPPRETRLPSSFTSLVWVTPNQELVSLGNPDGSTCNISIADASGHPLRTWHMAFDPRYDQAPLFWHAYMLMVNRKGMMRVIHLETGDVIRWVQIQDFGSSLVSVDGLLFCNGADRKSIHQVDPETGACIGASIRVTEYDPDTGYFSFSVVGVLHDEVYVRFESMEIIHSAYVDVYHRTSGALCRTLKGEAEYDVDAFAILSSGYAMVRDANSILLLY